MILLLLGFLLKPLPKFDQPKAIQLPWSLTSNNKVETHYQYLDNGQILIEITNIELIKITPQMLHWFYRNLPASRVKISPTPILNEQVKQQSLSWFQIFHQPEHGDIQVLEQKSGSATLIQKEEWFGPYHRQGNERMLSLSDQGMKVQFELAGLPFGHSEHNFIQVANGIEYKIKTIIGSDLPVIGPFINVILRYKMFPERMLEHWIRHQVEEINSLNSFLPQLFVAPKQENYYLLKLDAL